MEYMFLLADLKERSVLVVGGGNIAARKVMILKRSGAKIKVVADRLCKELKEMERLNDLIWIGKVFTSDMLNNVFFVIVATNNKEINNFIYQMAEARHKFVNVVDDKSKCSLIFPAIVDRSPVMVAISSSGKAPVLSRILREKLESLLPDFLGKMANVIGSWRSRVKLDIVNMANRRRFWEKILYNDIFSMLISKGLVKQADYFLAHALNNDKIILKKSIGSIALVGAGPGDVGLFTLRGLQLVQEADVILYDYLVTSSVLDLARRDAKKICVGKRADSGSFSMKQKTINRLLLRLAKKGYKVVRLKGGDPFIFGRGGEELEEIIKSGISYQVVPGITSALAASSYFGIPLTHRCYSHSVIFVTGYLLCSSDKKFDLRCLSYSKQTLVIYMGTIYASKIQKILIINGCDIKTPVAIISRGTYEDQKISIGTLDNLEELANTACSPSLLIVGKVVELHSRMHVLNKQDINKYKVTSLINLF